MHNTIISQTNPGLANRQSRLMHPEPSPRQKCQRILMCRPDYFDVDYIINPWMEGNLHQTQRDRVFQQWEKLYHSINQHATVELIPPQPGLPDFVFTANAGVIRGDKAIVSRFRHPQRQGEEPFFNAYFQQQGFTVYELPPNLPFEGAGDALLDRGEALLWAGYGFRSTLDSHAYLASWLDIEVVSLRLINSRFYHLDTCFCPLTGGYLLYNPRAFDHNSNRLIEKRIPKTRRIPISGVDAENFACNAVNIDNLIILHQASHELKHRLTTIGFQVIETPLSEFLKSGGTAKCLTLRLTEPIANFNVSREV